MRRYLTHLGHDLEMAVDGITALAVLLEGRHDIVLMDIHIPGMDGLEVVRNARQQGCTLPIVAVTALAMKGDEKRILRAGCDGYLAKPFHLNDLKTTLQTFLEGGKHP